MNNKKITVTIEDVLRATSEALNVDVSRIVGGDRDQDAVSAREIAMCIASEHCDISKSEMAERFNCSVVTVYERIRSSITRAATDSVYSSLREKVTLALGFAGHVKVSMDVAEAIRTLINCGFQISVHK